MELNKRIVISILVSFIFGLLCAYMSTIRKPIELTFWILVDTIYTRTIAGLFIGLLPSKSLSIASIKGLTIGFLLSLIMILPFVNTYGLSVVGFAIAGAVYGLITDVIATKYG